MPQSLYRPTRSPPGKLTQLLLLCARTSVNWEIVLRILEYCATRDPIQKRIPCTRKALVENSQF